MKKETNTDKRLLTVKKACQLYGLDSSLIYYWVRYRKFEIFKVGKKVLFSQSGFEDFLNSHKVGKYDEGVMENYSKMV